MKKILSLILALTFCFAAFSVFAPSVSAKSETISESEAKDLIVKAYEFCRNVRAGESRIHENSEEYRIEVKFGEKYSEREYYWLAKEENLPGGSYEKMCEYVETIYTKEAAPTAYAYKLDGTVNPSDNMWDGLYPLFYRNENGVLYASTSYLNYRGAYLFPDAEGVEFEIVSGDSDTAKANVSVKFFHGDGPRPYTYDIVECLFENTPDGWRIAESEFSIIMATQKAYFDDYRAKNPDAANPSGGGILVADVEEILRAVIGGLNYNIDKYEYYEFCTERAVEKLSSGCKAVAEKIGDEYHVTVNGVFPIAFVYDPGNTRIAIAESTDKEASVAIWLGLKYGNTLYPTGIVCEFKKGHSLWMLDDCEFVDMLITGEGFDGEAPVTGDNAYDTIALCLGGIAIIMSAICLARRKREIL